MSARSRNEIPASPSRCASVHAAARICARFASLRFALGMSLDLSLIDYLSVIDDSSSRGFQAIVDEPVEHLFEERLASVGGVVLERDVAFARRGTRLDRQALSVVARHPTVRPVARSDRSRPMATRRRGEHTHELLVIGPQAGEGLVLRLGRALAVVAGDLGDDLDLAVGEAR